MSDASDDLGDEVDETSVVEERIADAAEVQAIADGLDQTAFEESRHEYSGVVEDSDVDVDVAEYDEAGALFDDPERIALLQGGLDDPDGVDD
jgi:hypothetical protein